MRQEIFARLPHRIRKRIRDNGLPTFKRPSQFYQRRDRHRIKRDTINQLHAYLRKNGET
jgi:hypothetical protein